MESATGRHYMISAVKHRYTDRIPTTLLVGPYYARLTQFTMKEILTDAKKSAEAHLAFFNRFQPDSIVIYNDIYLEAEAVGCRLEFPEDDISRLKSSILKAKSQLVGLKVPDPQKDGRLPYFVELIERVSADMRKEVAVGAGHSGPWNLAMHLRGAEALLLDTMEDPEFVHALMTFTTEVVRVMGDTMIASGFSPSISEAYASCNLISPNIYRDFIKPYHKKLTDYFRLKKIPIALHICGFIDPIMEDIIDTGISFLSLDALSSLKKMLTLCGGKMTVMGNVNTSLFASGTEQEMEGAIRNCIETAAEGSGYILCSGCDIPMNSTEERVAYFFKYGHQFGRTFMAALKQRRPELFS